MASADWTIQQGDSYPTFTDPAAYAAVAATGPTLTGATIALVLRSLTSPTPLPLAGTPAINATTQAFTFAPTAADTATPGSYMAQWIVTFAGGATMRYPTDGYLWVTVEENLSTVGGQQLVSLPVVKDHLNIPITDRSHDHKLLRWIKDVRPVIEHITGPIIVQQFEEWKDGGNLYVSLNHSPSTGYGTTPVLNLMACSEYIVGVPTEWSLAIVDTPDKGTMYSCQLDLRRGRVIRRTAGGATQPFPAGPNTVHVIYQAGQSAVPDNVTAATLEMVRINYRPTMAVGRGAQAQADDQDTGPPLGFYMSKRCREMLSPNRRHPSFA